MRLNVLELNSLRDVVILHTNKMHHSLRVYLRDAFSSCMYLQFTHDALLP